MTVKYLDPYKDDPYGKLRGEKADTWFSVNFDEAKVYPIDNGYVLAGFFTGYSGVIRNYKASEPVLPGLCALPIYSQEYESRVKGDDGNWTTVKNQPSKYEKVLCGVIDANSELWLPEGKGIGGEISFSPDQMVQSMDETAIKAFIDSTVKIETVTLSGKLPEYKPPSTGSYKKGSSKSWSVSPDQKLEFVKKELISSIAASGFTEENSLGCLTIQMIAEHEDDDKFLSIYFDMLMAIVR